jgi:hypothetical protein
MTRTITAALIAVALMGAVIVPAHAQQPSGTVVVPAPAPAPSASPGTTVVAPSASGTTIVTPPGSTVTVTPPAVTTTTAVAVSPWCEGAYAPGAGTNFGNCPGTAR